MNKLQLVRSFNSHGIGTVRGYGWDGYVGSYYIRHTGDVARLPAHLVYEWAD